MDDSNDVPVTQRDLVGLVLASVLGGLAIASWIMSPAPSPEFAVAILSGSTMLLFFLFVPVMGLRLFLDERAEE